MNSFKLSIAKLLLSYSQFLLNKLNKQLGRKRKKIDLVNAEIERIIESVKHSQGEME